MFLLGNMRRKHSPELQAGLNEVSRLVRLNRQAGKMSLGELAVKSQISKGNLSKIENGSGNIELVTIFKIARAMAVAPSALLPDKWL